jgi:hypothetical protein
LLVLRVCSDRERNGVKLRWKQDFTFLKKMGPMEMIDLIVVAIRSRSRVEPKQLGIGFMYTIRIRIVYTKAVTKDF